jgi:hypothetical protein
MITTMLSTSIERTLIKLLLIAWLLLNQGTEQHLKSMLQLKRMVGTLDPEVLKQMHTVE